MNFVEAVKDLAGQYGMQVPEEDASPQDRARAAQQREKQATLTDVLEKAGEAYRKHLKSSPRAVDYLKGRGLSGEIARQFGLGYAPEGWRSLASVFPNYDDPLLAESGLVIVNEDEDKRYDRFRDRVMFPIRNVKGECIGFGGRVLGDEKPKYLNSPETPVFSKGRELYGLFEARNALREHGYVLVTEGYMDVVALAQLGLSQRRGHAGHRLHPRPRAEAVPLHRRGGVQLRRRRGRPARRPQGARRRPALRHRRAHGEVPVPAGRARPGQLHPRVRPRRLLPATSSEAMPLSRFPGRGCARRLRPRHCRRARPHGRQCQAAVEAAARRRPEAAVAGENWPSRSQLEPARTAATVGVAPAAAARPARRSAGAASSGAPHRKRGTYGSGTRHASSSKP